MKIRGLSYALFSCAAVGVAATLAACEAAQPAVKAPAVSGSPFIEVPHRLRRGGLPSAVVLQSAQFLFVANKAQNVIDIFPRKGRLQSPVGTIDAGIAGPYGLYTDKRSRLYVTNWNYGSVTVYSPRNGYAAPIATYTQKLSRPLYPIVDGDGDLFVSIAESGTVVEFKLGTTSVYRLLSIPNAVEADGMDFDREGNLYVAYRNEGLNGYGSIEEFAPGSSQGTSLGMSLDQPQGLVVDNNGNILAVETGAANRIDLFAPGQQMPSLEVALPQGAADPEFPVQLAMPRSERSLKVSALSGDVFTMRYPLSGRTRVYLKDRTHSLSEGVALTGDQTF